MRRSLRRSGSGVRGSGPQPGSRKPGGTARPARGPVCEEHRWTRKRGWRRKPAVSSSPGSAASRLKTAAVERREARRPSGRTYGLPKRLIGAPPPSFWGKRKKDQGRPGAQLIRAAERWLAAVCLRAGLFDIVRFQRASREPTTSGGIWSGATCLCRCASRPRSHARVFRASPAFARRALRCAPSRR
jgi:hypothetical protein